MIPSYSMAEKVKLRSTIHGSLRLKCLRIDFRMIDGLEKREMRVERYESTYFGANGIKCQSIMKGTLLH